MLLAFHMGVWGHTEIQGSFRSSSLVLQRIGTTVPNCPRFCSHSSCPSSGWLICSVASICSPSCSEPSSFMTSSLLLTSAQIQCPPLPVRFDVFGLVRLSLLLILHQATSWSTKLSFVCLLMITFWVRQELKGVRIPV